MRNAPVLFGLAHRRDRCRRRARARRRKGGARQACRRLIPISSQVTMRRSSDWRDGTTMPVSDGVPNKSFDQRLRNASLLDQLLLPYPKGPLTRPPSPQDDPGRFRNEAFFDTMYGNCEKGEVQKHLVTIAWLPKSWGGHLKVTDVNGVATKLQAISAELDALPASAAEIRLSKRRDVQLSPGQGYRQAQHARLWRRNRSQCRVFRLLALAAA